MKVHQSAYHAGAHTSALVVIIAGPGLQTIYTHSSLFIQLFF